MYRLYRETPEVTDEQHDQAENEVIFFEDTEHGPKLRYHVNRDAIIRIVTTAGHSRISAGRAVNLLERLDRKSPYNPSIHGRDYEVSKPRAVVVAPDSDGKVPYFDLSAMDDVIGYIKEVDFIKYTHGDMKIETTIGYVGDGVLDVFETMSTYYDFCCDQINAVN